MVVEEAIMIVAVPVFAAWALWLVFRRYQLQVQARMQRTETFNRMIDKFGTSSEFVDFLQTETGRKFLEDPATSPAHPMAGVRRSIQGGTILFVLGGALFVNALRLRGETDINYVRQAMGLNYWGTIFIGCGVGLLVAAALSHALAKRWR
jgi:hypothetical protein